MRARVLRPGALLAAVWLLGACNPPKYVTFRPPERDWMCSVPFGWNVMTDNDGRAFTQVNLIGPFDPAFYLGAPSFSVRWYAYNMPHRLPDGLVESFASTDDFIAQVIPEVYGSQLQYSTPPHEIKVDGGRRLAKHFVVLSAGPADPNAQYGVAIDQADGSRINPRQHAYVLIPLARGFYVLTYPATRMGFKTYEPQFNQLVNSFHPVTEGPGGSAATAPAAAAAPAAPAKMPLFGGKP